MSKISHLLQMIIILQYKEITTASELADILEVDKKTIYRYINSLNQANIPVYTKKGRYGGFYIDKEFYMKPSKLSEEELQSLLIATQILTEENGFSHGMELKMAVTKIKALSIDNDRDLKILNYNGDFNINEIGNLQNIESKILKINFAMSRRRTLSINYFSINKNDLTIRKVDPYNLIFREGTWYIIGNCHMNNKVEAFQLTRIKSMKITEEIYFKPYTFSLKEYLQNSWGVFNGEKNKIAIRFNKEADSFITDTKWHINQQIEYNEDGTITLIFYLDETNNIKSWIMGFGNIAEVIEPTSLRNEIKKEIEEMYKKY